MTQQQINYWRDVQQASTMLLLVLESCGVSPNVNDPIVYDCTEEERQAIEFMRFVGHKTQEMAPPNPDDTDFQEMHAKLKWACNVVRNAAWSE
jgi:hypothetical protein